MIKISILAIALAASSIPAFANCQITYSSASSQVEKSFSGRDGWAINDYNTVCEKLKRANAALRISGYSTVLDGVSYAGASVGVKDMNVNIYSDDFGGSSVSVNPTASMDKAVYILFDSIMNAVNSMNIDKALASLAAERKKAKKG